MPKIRNALTEPIENKHNFIVFSIGSNLGDRSLNLAKARALMHLAYPIVAKSNLFTSEAVDNFDQPDFLNQIIVCSDNFPMKNPMLNALKILETTQKIEKTIGRSKSSIFKGPRIIDIDIIFVNFTKVKTDILEIPHKSWDKRNFVIIPLKELYIYSLLRLKFEHSQQFLNKITLYSSS